MKEETLRLTESAGQREDAEPSLLRTHKDSVFRLLFNDKERALELYNAISGSNYGPDAAFRFTTLEDVILKTKKNDISFLLEDALEKTITLFHGFIHERQVIIIKGISP